MKLHRFSLSLESRYLQFLKGRSYRFYCLIFLFSAYGVGIFPSLIWNEEYPGLLDPYSYSLDQFRDGRPIYGFTTLTFLGIAKYTGMLWPYRLFGFVGLSFLVVYVVRAVYKSNFENRDELAAASLIAFTLPAFQTLVNSGNVAIYSWASLFSCIAFTSQRQRKYYQSLFFASASILMYPVSTLFIFSFGFLITYLSTKREIKDFLNELFRVILLLVLSGLLSAMIAFGFLEFLFNLAPKSRVGVVHPSEFLTNLVFFMTRFVPTNAGLFFYGSYSILSALLVTFVFLVLISLFWQFTKKAFKKELTTFIFLFVYAFFACSISLFAKTREIDVRFIRNSSWLLCVFFIFKFFTFVKSMKFAKNRPEIVHTLILVFALVAATEANYRYFHFFKTPFDEKTRYIDDSLARCSFSELKNGVVIRMPKQDFERYNNIGIYSLKTDLSQAWVPLANVTLLARKKTLREVSVEFESLQALGGLRTQCLVDLSRFKP